jgi:hypothetical protein
MDVITFFDAHAGAITGLATVALVIATVILAYLNFKLWISQDMPRLYFSLKLEDKTTPTHTGEKVTIFGKEVELIKTGDYVLYVTNIGKGPAFEIHFDLEDLGSPFAMYIDCLMPKEKRRITKLPEIQYKVTGLVYKDINGRKIKKKLILDLVSKGRIGQL